MSAIRSGQATAFFMYDVADAIDLQTVRSLTTHTIAARLAPRPPTPAYVQYKEPPLSIDGDAVGVAEIAGFHVRFKIFDYGVVSVALTHPVPPTWPELVAHGLEWHDDAHFMPQAEKACRTLVKRLAPAMTAPREHLVTEDYLVFTLTDVDDAPSAEALLAAHGSEIAQLLRGEREPLSAQERDDVLRHRISYLVNDLVVPTWNAALVYDTEAGAQAAIEILELIIVVILMVELVLFLMGIMR